MDEIFGFQWMDKAFLMMSPENLIPPVEYGYDHSMEIIPSDDQELEFQCSVLAESASVDVQKDEDEENIKARIASHPSYPKLLDAYIDCQKVGAPPEMICLLDERRQEKQWCKQDDDAVSICLGADPELDEFMETYYDMLVKLKADLWKPFHEATSFINKIEAKLRNLCNENGDPLSSNNDDELSYGQIEIQDAQLVKSGLDQWLKEKLLHRYGGHINGLKLEISKKKKKIKLPKEATQALQQWWELHSNWPYPTETDKVRLAELTGLDHKQVNIWFINQRKRHWKSPMANMHSA